MAEIDTTPLESVKAAVDLFDRGSDQSRLSCPDGNEEDQIAILTKELAACKLQLEVREKQHKQATMQIEALQKAVQALSGQYEKDCMDARLRIAQLEAENVSIMSRQSEADGECEALRGELAAVKADLDAARASVAFVLREVEAMETRAILEREGTKDALARILLLNETVLSSAVAAIRAEEERSVFFQEATLRFFDSDDRNLEVVRGQTEMMEHMEADLLAKTVEVEYLRAELKQAREIYVSPQRASDATTMVVSSAAGCSNLGVHDQVQGRGTAVEDTEAEPEFTFQHSPGLSLVSDEIFTEDCRAVPPPGGSKMETDTSDDLAENENKQGTAVMVEDTTTVAEGNSDAQETRSCLVARVSGEDNHANQRRVRFKCIEADSSQEPAESDGALPDFTACQGKGNDDVLVQDHVGTVADASFVLETSRDDFQIAHSDAKDVISIAEPENVASAANNQEPGAEPAAAPPTSTPREGSSDTCVVVTEIVSKDEDEFYTKELEPEPGQGQGTKQLDGYVLVSKGGDAGADVAVKDKQLDEARTEMSDLRFSLEEAVRRAELAEEAKVALERELREEIRRKHTPARRRTTSYSEDGWRLAAAREGRPTPSRTSATPSHASGTPSRTLRSARPGGEDMPTPRSLTLGKVLNMKYK